MNHYQAKAQDIIENLIHFDAWRDNLHHNDFPVTKAKIATALQESENLGFEKAAQLLEKNAAGTVNGKSSLIPDELVDETRKRYIEAIRALKWAQ